MFWILLSPPLLIGALYVTDFVPLSIDMVPAGNIHWMR